MALGEYLKGVPIRGLHRAANFRDVPRRNVIVKKIAHGVDEDSLWHPPSQRNIELLWNQAKVESVLERVPRYPAKSLCESFGVAVFAARAYFGAAPYWIPRRIRPFYGAVITHSSRRSKLLL